MKRHLGIITALSAALLATSGTALADNDFSLHLEPALAVPLSAPQSNLYNPGIVLGAKGMFALTPNLSVGPSVSALYLSRAINTEQNAGVLWQFGGSARLQGDRRNTNTHPVTSLFNPWVDVDVAAAVTGDLALPAVDVGLGAEIPFDDNHIAWMGPFVRYTHVFQTSNTEGGLNLDGRDVNIFQIGLSVSFDTPTSPKVRTTTVTNTVVRVQHDVVASHPTVTPVAPVEKLDLSERVYFDFNSANLRWESRDKLDNLVKVLNTHPKFNLQVEGNASADGQLSYNEKLSNQRTLAVVEYLSAHGVDRSRLTPVNRGVANPTAPNSTKEGRERNRRVEFEVRITSVEQGK